MKKTKGFFFLVAAALLITAKPNVAFAAADKNMPDTISVNSVSTMKQNDSMPVSWQHNFEVKDYGENVAEYLKFTIAQDSIIDFAVSADATDRRLFSASDCHVALYTDSNYSNMLTKINADGDTTLNSYGEKQYQLLSAGTYYVKAFAEKPISFQCKYTQYIKICALPFNSIYTLSYNKKKTNCTFQLKEDCFRNVSKCYYLKGTDSTSRLGLGYSTGQKAFSGKFKVSKKGVYTVYVRDDINGKDGDFSFQIHVDGPDKTKPVVSGVKHNKAYKKAVIITFKDNEGGSGIKKATLNGKKIKSGKKVSKKGNYTLKVYDNAGNCRVVNFTIK